MHSWATLNFVVKIVAKLLCFYLLLLLLMQSLSYMSRMRIYSMTFTLESEDGVICNKGLY